MKNILLTGSGGNLGKAVVKKLLAEKHHIVATVNPGPGQPENKKKKNLQIKPLNVLDEKACEKFSGLNPNMDVVILLVGGFHPGTLKNTGVDDLKKMNDLNFSSAYNLLRPYYYQMLKQSIAGHFIFIGSKAGLHGKDSKESLAYGLSKSLLFRLAETINSETPKTNIRATVIVPGTMDTPENRKAMPKADFSCWVEPTDVAEAIAFCVKADKLRETVIKVYGKV